MNEETENILQQITNERNITLSSKRLYWNAVEQYEQVQGLPLKELLEEAEKEEDQGIRWKHRRLRHRLTNYQNHMITNYKYGTAKNYISRVKTIYHYYDIEIHNLPRLNRRQANYSEPILYKDLPTKKTLQEAYQIMTPAMRAILLFSISTGCSKREVLNFKLSDYYHWIDPYTPQQVLEEHIDIVPVIYTYRSKTNHHYYTFCTPETIREIARYLQTRKDHKEDLFKLEYKYASVLFQKYNDELGLGRKNNMNILRSHMLRKFHASQLHSGDYPLSLDEIDSLQGRSKNTVRESYYFDNPYDLRKKYIRNIDQVTILDEVHTITVDSPEVMELKEKAAKIDELEKLVKKILEKNGGMTPMEQNHGGKNDKRTTNPSQ